MRPALFIAYMLYCTTSVFSQTDTIFKGGAKIPCVFWGLNSGDILYTSPGQSGMQRIKLREIDSLLQKNGKVIRFINDFHPNHLGSARDYQKVVITDYDKDIEGLFKIGETSSKATGITSNSDDARIQEKAINAFRINAALRGANVIFLESSTQQVGSGIHGGDFATRPQTSLAGGIYTSEPISVDEVREKLAGKSQFTGSTVLSCPINSEKLKETSAPFSVSVEKIMENHEIVEIQAVIQGTSATVFPVVYLSDSTLTLMEVDGKSIRNYIVKL